jgi:hypothetical protein
MNKLVLAAAALIMLSAASAYGGARAAGAGQGPTAGEAQCSTSEEIVKGVYQQLLERVPDPETMQSLTAQLTTGAKSVRELVRDTALSDEFKGKYTQGRPEEAAVGILYQRIFARGGSPQEYRPWVEAAKAQGFASVIDGLINGPEYAREFGERGVPGRPVTLRACRFPATFSRVEEAGPGRKMTTTVTISADGRIDLFTKIENSSAGAGPGFCGRVGLWLLDEKEGVVGIVGPDRGERWCLGGPGPRPAERADEWHGQVNPETLRKVSAVAVLQTTTASDPLDPTRENAAKAKQSKQSLR